MITLIAVCAIISVSITSLLYFVLPKRIINLYCMHVFIDLKYGVKILIVIYCTTYKKFNESLNDKTVFINGSFFAHSKTKTTFDELKR